MSQSAFFPVKPSVSLYSDRKPPACQKLGNGPGVGKCPVPGQCKICKCPTPGTDKAGKCPAVARGGGGDWAQVELTDALRELLKNGPILSHIFHISILFWSYSKKKNIQ